MAVRCGIDYEDDDRLSPADRVQAVGCRCLLTAETLGARLSGRWPSSLRRMTTLTT